jgi:hypothetical protein
MLDQLPRQTIADFNVKNSIDWVEIAEPHRLH